MGFLFLLLFLRTCLQYFRVKLVVDKSLRCMKNSNKILLLIGFCAVAFSCSTRKDNFINRSYHSVTSKYNILFNGKEAFKEGIKGIEDNYKDDYFSQLPIEPIEFEEDKIEIPKFDAGGFSGFDKKEDEEAKKSETPFDKAEEKAVKAIQLHSMNIQNRERNPQIDDAYLLLGKSRYYSQRFVPAIEAFNYIIANYPDASLINETKIWRAKTNIRLENEKFAIESLKFLIDVRKGEEDLPEEIKEQAHTALAMAYVKTDSIQNAIEQLKLATQTLNNREQGARNLFVLGQIYSNQNKRDSAAFVFNRLTEFKKAPYKYKIRANVELAKNFPQDSSSIEMIARLEKLIKNRDNRPYLDELYYQKAVLEEKNDSISDAIITYNKSLRANNGSDKQKTFTYENLGNLYFSADDYLLANSYYDSVLKVAKDDTDLRIRRVKRKSKNLTALVKNEEIVRANDSILNIASLSQEEQKIYFGNYISKIKKEDEERAQQQLNQIAFGNSFGGSLQATNKGKWYFYNSQSLGFGEVEFQKVWGNRALADNWRWSDKVSINEFETDSIVENQVVSRYDLDAYLDGIPNDIMVLDSLKISRNQALFELGLIYKEQFKNPDLAIERLERLKMVNEDENLKLPVYYNLYQLYTSTGDLEKATLNKNSVLNDFPESIQAQIIKFPNKEITEDETKNETEELYKEIYYLYKEEQYEEVVAKVEETLSELENSVLIPKFELLRAYAIGKYKDKRSFRIALEYIAFSYPNSPEGKKAQELVSQIQK